MNILLVNPRISAFKIYGPLAPLSANLPSLGLAYLASFLENSGHTVRILDICVDRYSRLFKLLTTFKPDVVGFTCTTVSFENARRTICELKKRFPAVLILMGGSHISALPEETMEACKEIDIGVYGEGELALLGLVESLEGKHKLSDCNGIIYRENSSLIKNRVLSTPLCKNL